ncbi:MAG: hypothetical protein AAB426_13415 [Myxococcota bacterium]
MLAAVVAVALAASPVVVQSATVDFVRDVQRLTDELSALLGVVPPAAVEVSADNEPPLVGTVGVDIDALYGLVAHGVEGLRWASRLQRLGFERLDKLALRVARTRGASVVASVRVGPLAPRALEVLGPPLTWGRWRERLSERRTVAWVSVRPAALWGALARLAAIEEPVAYGLYRAQLDALADQMGIDWLAALGDAPQPLASCRLRGEPGATGWAVALRAADGAALAKLFLAYGALLGQLGLPVTVHRDASGVALAIQARGARHSSGAAHAVILRLGDPGLALAGGEAALRCAQSALGRQAVESGADARIAVGVLHGEETTFGGRWRSVEAQLDGTSLAIEAKGEALTR